MDCKQAEQNISGFLNHSLLGDELRPFLHHVKNCPTCKEELGTSYLLEVALQRIEEGETVKLDDELNNRLAQAEEAMNYHWIMSNVFRSIEVVAGIVLSFGAVRTLIIYILPFITG